MGEEGGREAGAREQCGSNEEAARFDKLGLTVLEIHSKKGKAGMFLDLRKGVQKAVWGHSSLKFRRKD